MRFILPLAMLAGSVVAAHAGPDVIHGEQVFKQCAACHAVGPNAKAKVGPPLNAIVGRAWAQVQGFSYSSDLKSGGAAGKVWDETTLDAYIANPRAVAPSGRMPFGGLRVETDRLDLIAFLSQFDAAGEKK